MRDTPLHEIYKLIPEWGIDVTRYRVDQELRPFIWAVAGFIERADELVDYVKINPLTIRAYAQPHSKEDLCVPVVEVAVPEGFYVKLVSLSDEPNPEKWPEDDPAVVAEWQARCDAAEKALFPPGIPTEWRAWMNVYDLAEIRKLYHFEAITLREYLMKGHYGNFKGRQIWCSRFVEKGTVQFLRPADLPLNDPLFKADPATTFCWPGL